MSAEQNLSVESQLFMDLKGMREVFEKFTQNIVEESIHFAVSDKVYRDNFEGGTAAQFLEEFKDEAIPSKQWFVNYVYQQAEAMRSLRLFSQSKVIIAMTYLDRFLVDIQQGNYLIGLLSARALVETIAVHHDVLRKISNALRSNEAQPHKGFTDLLRHGLRKRRIDWLSLAKDANFRIEDLPAYKPTEDYTLNYHSDQILYSVDRLGKKVKGARNAYDYLCEFTHPNVGTFLAVTKEFKEVEVSPGFAMGRYILSEFPPHLSTSSNGIFGIEQVIHIIACCVATFDQDVCDAVPRALSKIQPLVQIDVRRLLGSSVPIKGEELRTTNYHFFDAYSKCPCASESKFKFCCGKRA